MFAKRFHNFYEILGRGRGRGRRRTTICAHGVLRSASRRAVRLADGRRFQAGRRFVLGLGGAALVQRTRPPLRRIGQRMRRSVSSGGHGGRGCAGARGYAGRSREAASDRRQPVRRRLAVRQRSVLVDQRFGGGVRRRRLRSGAAKHPVVAGDGQPFATRFGPATHLEFGLAGRRVDARRQLRNGVHILLEVAVQRRLVSQQRQVAAGADVASAGVGSRFAVDLRFAIRHRLARLFAALQVVQLVQRVQRRMVFGEEGVRASETHVRGRFVPRRDTKRGRLL